MQMFIRLHDPADMDLIFLKLKYRNKFPGMIRKCLHSHMGGEDFKISFPDDMDRFAKHPAFPLHVNLNLREDNDANIIEYLSGVRAFAKSDVVKTIIRSCYEAFPSDLFRPPFVGAGEIIVKVPDKKENSAPKKLIIKKEDPKPYAKKETPAREDPPISKMETKDPAKPKEIMPEKEIAKKPDSSSKQANEQQDAFSMLSNMINS